eukprot:gene20210-31073_t
MQSRLKGGHHTLSPKTIEGWVGSMFASRALAGGFFLKMADDIIDDGIWHRAMLLPALLLSCLALYSDIVFNARHAAMMSAFTIGVMDTNGLDNPYFKVAAFGVFVASAFAFYNEPWTWTDFHFHHCLLGTAYSEVLVTRADSWCEKKMGFAGKTCFRLTLAFLVNKARPFVPQEYLTQHEFLFDFLVGYYTAH